MGKEGKEKRKEQKGKKGGGCTEAVDAVFLLQKLYTIEILHEALGYFSIC